MKRNIILAIALAAAGLSLHAQDDVTPADQAAIIDAAAPALVRVEYTLKHDKGEAPRTGYASESLIAEERPLEMPGYLVSRTGVLTPDPGLHPRFVERIEVRFRDRVVPVKISAYPKRRAALILELAEPLEGAKPLSFDRREPPYFSLHYWQKGGEWATTLKPFAPTVTAADGGRRFFIQGRDHLIVDAKGMPVGAVFSPELPLGDSWMGSPLDWPSYTSAEFNALLDALKRRADETLIRVELDFRSPQKDERARFWDEHEDVTERNVCGILVDEQTVLVLANLDPRTTARLERITVHTGGGKAVAAKFLHTLKDYGCLLAKLDEPLRNPIRMMDKGIMEFLNVRLLSAEVTVQGEKRTTHFWHDSFDSCRIGWRRQLYVYGERDKSQYLFDEDMNLVALPIGRRKKVSEKDSWSRFSDTWLTPAVYIKQVLADVEKHVDPNNVPLAEGEEHRLAWMGVELQPLDRELARANKVSDLTRDGQTGAIVSYVYPGSPADKAGVKPGFILLRIHVAGDPKPLEIDAKSDEFGYESFPWGRMDEIPEEYFDRMPKPWPSAESSLNRALTDLGFGKKYSAEFFHDGKTFHRDFEVVQSPPHFASAPRYEAKALGLNVRDMTYEVRRYFRHAEDEPGLVISKIEPGSKASVSGLKPYEIITHVNDQPVKSVDDFKKLIKGQAELRLSVKRMTRRRIVKITMGADAGKAGGD